MFRRLARVGRVALICVSCAPAACQTFVRVERSGDHPVFDWAGGQPAMGLVVRPVQETCDGDAGLGAKDVYWQLSGTVTPPVTYGVAPKGATEIVKARKLSAQCDKYVVTITDQTMRGESATFSP